MTTTVVNTIIAFTIVDTIITYYVLTRLAARELAIFYMRWIAGGQRV